MSAPKEKTADEANGDSPSSERRPQKKRKVDASVAAGKAIPREGSVNPDPKVSKPANPLGSIIGRKRKMRKAKEKP